MSERELLEVGDKVVIENFLGRSVFPITRVTKTLALSKRESDGYEYKFKREISHNMSYPKDIWSNNTYNVIKK